MKRGKLFAPPPLIRGMVLIVVLLSHITNTSFASNILLKNFIEPHQLKQLETEHQNALIELNKLPVVDAINSIKRNFKGLETLNDELTARFLLFKTLGRVNLDSVNQELVDSLNGLEKYSSKFETELLDGPYSIKIPLYPINVRIKRIELAAKQNEFILRAEQAISEGTPELLLKDLDSLESTDELITRRLLLKQENFIGVQLDTKSPFVEHFPITSAWIFLYNRQFDAFNSTIQKLDQNHEPVRNLFYKVSSYFSEDELLALFESTRKSELLAPLTLLHGKTWVAEDVYNSTLLTLLNDKHLGGIAIKELCERPEFIKSVQNKVIEPLAKKRVDACLNKTAPGLQGGNNL